MNTTLTSLAIPALRTAAEGSPAPLIPLRDFFRNEESFRYRLSANGPWISWLAPFEGRMNIHVMPAGGGDTIRVTNVTERDIPTYFWSGENELLYIMDTGGDENFRLYAARADGSNTRILTPAEGIRVEIIDELKDFPDELIISTNQRNPQVFDPYRLNIASGEMTMLAENPGNIISWLTDHEGKLRVAVATLGTDVALLYREDETQEFRGVDTFDFRQSLQPLLFSFDNKHVYCSSNLGRDKSAIVLYDMAANKELSVLFESNEYDLSNLSYSHKRKVLTSVKWSSWKGEEHFLDEATRQMHQEIRKQLGAEREITILDATDDESQYMFVTNGDVYNITYYLYSAADKSIRKVAGTRAWINEDHLARMQPIQYKSRDGLTINGYLTIPKGMEGKNLPVVVNPHGGPWYRDQWGYNPEVQFLANRGYAVLQMNFRGSLGYGRSFWESSFKQWGKTMQDDISDGVAWLVEQGIADPDRVAIYGGSYGGYATLAGLTFTPDLYAAGVDYVGVSNMFTFMESIPAYWEPMRKMMYEMVGDPVSDAALLESVSPVMHADKITAPLLIAQGARDPRVNINESDQMVDALRSRGVEVQYLVKENEGHGFANEENRFEFYGAMEKFLAEHLKGNKERSGASL
ncbi:MAG: prolyl oligopeptidase family serine peptidase [Bacteroidetes bacterium]|nr:prolyl oligopeptidase family serine peptidase [Bacteroidota bacterium]